MSYASSILVSFQIMILYFCSRIHLIIQTHVLFELIGSPRTSRKFGREHIAIMDVLQ